MLGPDVFGGMTVAAKQAALAQAQAAYVQMMTGAKGVSFSYSQGDGGKSVTYAPTSVANLQLFIRQLQQSLGIVGRTRRPIRFTY